MRYLTYEYSKKLSPEPHEGAARWRPFFFLFWGCSLLPPPACPSRTPKSAAVLKAARFRNLSAPAAAKIYFLKFLKLKINKNEILRPYKPKTTNYRAYFLFTNFLKQNFQFNFVLFLFFFIKNSLRFHYLNFNGKIKKNVNPQAPVAQKIADEVVFRRFQGEGVEFF